MTEPDNDTSQNKGPYTTWPNPPADGEAGELPADEAEATDDDPAFAQLAAVSAERDEYLDQLQRSRAEFANYRRRVEQERQIIGDLAKRDALIQFLPVVDDFERALAAVPEAERSNSWLSGITLIQQKLAGILERAGVSPIDALGQPFDPSLHEAVASEPGTAGSHVVEVYQKGYRVGDQLARPAMVKTGNPPAGAAADATNADDSPKDAPAFDA
ncbi:MAG: nucleotide exchange factor GrpE [Thermomicrobiales bacterium]